MRENQEIFDFDFENNILTIADELYPLKEISVDEVKELRRKRVPSFIFKRGGRLYHTVIPRGINFLNAEFLPHRCASGKVCKVCNRLSAAKDPAGCAAIRCGATRIENYPFVEIGFETFSNGYATFVVGKCANYEETPPRKARSQADIMEAKLGLAQYVFPDVQTLAEAKQRRFVNFTKK